MKRGPRGDVGVWTGRILAAGLLAVLALAAASDRASRLSEPLRQARPIVGLLSARFSGQEPVVPPTLYLIVYGPGSRTVDLVQIPPDAPLPEDRQSEGGTLADVYGNALAPDADVLGASRAMGRTALDILQMNPAWPAGRDVDFWFEWELPSGARPAFPREILERITAGRKDPFFWLRFPHTETRITRSEISGLSAYDVFLLTRELAGLGPERFQLSLLPEPGLMKTFLGRVFARSSGLPEPTGDLTVEVLNATEIGGVALRATKVLRFEGFDVVHFGNARTMEASVRVIDRAGLPGGARAVLRALGCPEQGILTAMEDDPGASITVFLGRDFVRCDKLKR